MQTVLSEKEKKWGKVDSWDVVVVIALGVILVMSGVYKQQW